MLLLQHNKTLIMISNAAALCFLLCCCGLIQFPITPLE
jgi:hypothetical protein